MRHFITHACMHVDNYNKVLLLTQGWAKHTWPLGNVNKLQGANVVVRMSAARAKACNMLVRDKQ
jgi:hypothetical protein